jgi:3'(2'), 5'-bisphosphate nucleotidase
MSPTTSLSGSLRIEDLLLPAVRAAILAGAEILKVYASDFSIEFKDDRSPLTLADKNAHWAIATSLAFSGIPMLSEEGADIPFSERKELEHLWIVDPLDGTKEFVKKNGEFTVNIALIRNHVPVLGVIYQPTESLLYFGCEGLGSFKSADIKPDFVVPKTISELPGFCQSLPLPSTRSSVIVSCSRSHLNDETSAFVSGLERNLGAISFLQSGSSLKFCKVAEGSADVYPRFGPTMEWDTAAGQAIAENAGSEVLDWSTGKRMLYNREQLLNSSFIAKGPRLKDLKPLTL